MTFGPFKCPDCGVWWAGLEHRCKRTETVTTGDVEIGGTYTLKCSCHFDAWGKRVQSTAFCPIHDVNVTYTVMSTAAIVPIRGAS